MAKGKKKGKKNRRQMLPGGDVATASLDEHRMPGEASEASEPGSDEDSGEPNAERSSSADSRVGAGGRVVRPARVGGGGLSVYKPGQGYYTRVGTAIGAGILIAGLWNMLYGELEIYVDADVPWTFYLQIGVPTLVAVALGFLIYWVVGKNRRTCDFMILTEGEMKKVSWSTRREVIGSTKVVIFTVIAMAVLLFVVDLGFSFFFHWIGVLKLAPSVFVQVAGEG